MMIKRVFAMALLAMAPVLAGAQSATEQLRQFIDTVKSATGQFQQTRQDGTAGQTGEFSFERPGKFRWEVVKPYEQLILSDGKVLYQYDPDLMQVTQRPVDQSIGTSPAAILFGSGSLDEAFNLTALPDAEGMAWLRAVPRGADAGFTHLDIAFREGMPARLLLLDAFGQTTRIELSGIEPNAKLEAGVFSFKPPEGVDVVRLQ